MATGPEYSDAARSRIVNAIRALPELMNVADPAWPQLHRALVESPVPVTVLPVERALGEDTLYRLQVTARSILGALALHTGGVLVDHGWLRLLGGGSGSGGELPDVASANRLADPAVEQRAPGSLVVAFDVLGGRFAVNGGELPGSPGEVCYFAPDTLSWEPVGGGHSAFVSWAIGGGLDEFYRDLRWPGWQDEIADLSPGRGLSVFPPLWSSEGYGNLARTAREPASLMELVSLYEDAAKQLADLPDGAKVQVRIVPPRT